MAAGLTEQQLQRVALQAFAIVGQSKKAPILAQVAEAGGEAATAVSTLLQQSPELGEQPALAWPAAVLGACGSR